MSHVRASSMDILSIGWFVPLLKYSHQINPTKSFKVRVGSSGCKVKTAKGSYDLVDVDQHWSSSMSNNIEWGMSLRIIQREKKRNHLTQWFMNKFEREMDGWEWWTLDAKDERDPSCKVEKGQARCRIRRDLEQNTDSEINLIYWSEDATTERRMEWEHVAMWTEMKGEENGGGRCIWNAIIESRLAEWLN